jgi:hypothetical protein
MNYSVNRLTKAADCDAVIARINKEKANLEFEKLSVLRDYEFAISRSTKLTADIQVATQEIAVYDQVIAGLPEGEIKEEQLVKRRKADNRLFNYNEFMQKYGSTALLEMEMKVNLIDKQLAELLVLTQAIEARKAAL